MPVNPQAVDIISLLTHRSFLVRAATGIIIGTLIFFSVWAGSLAWLPDGFFLALPRPSINSCLQNVGETLRAFFWNLVLTGGLTVFASLFVLNRFRLGYIVPWMTFALYGGMLGTNSFGCPNPDGAIPISLSILWARAGFREIMGYLLIAAALGNLYLWQQPSFFKMQTERVRSWKEFTLSRDAIIGLCQEYADYKSRTNAFIPWIL